MNFNYWALHYLNLWLSRDRRFCEALEGHDEAAKLQALSEAATFYKVARNLPKAFDIEKKFPRYKPVLDVIDALNPSMFQGSRLIPSIEQVRSHISERYGDLGVTSLTTEFLWLKMKSPIIIYDSRARKALGMKADSLRAYYEKWRERFDSSCNEINAACASLPKVHQYSEDPELATPRYIERIASQPWFRERVFDVYLWTKGS
ncbi:MAG TPA: hypothetical protein VN956_25190 [Pyrinomonadaceae bacterium]|nr:hypothetical protein [Pyrinomonadaceae bacterium]